MRSARRMRLPDRSMTRWLSLALVSGLAGCALDAVPGETPDESLEARRGEATEIAVSWRPIDFSADAAAFSFELAIENRGRAALGASGWHLYFNFVRRILPDGTHDGTLVQDLAGQGIRIAPAEAAARGDFFVLEPAPGFVPVRPGERRALTLLGENWAIMKTDAPAAFHIPFDGHGAPRGAPRGESGAPAPRARRSDPADAAHGRAGGGRGRAAWPHRHRAPEEPHERGAL